MEITALIDVKQLNETVVENLTAQWASMIAFLPNLFGALIILLIGLIFAFAFKMISRSLLRRMGLDRISNKVGVSDVMEDAGFAKRPSTMVSKIVFWLVWLIFWVPAANVLGLEELVNLFKSFIAFLPNVIIAFIIIILGVMFARFLRKSIQDKPSTIGSRSAKTLGNMVYGIMVTVVVLIGLNQLDIETELLHSIIMLVVSGMMLALALSIGFGTKAIAHNLLAGIYAREQFKPGMTITIDDIKGEVKEVTALNTFIMVGDDTLSIPNAMLYDHAVTLSETS